MTNALDTCARDLRVSPGALTDARGVQAGFTDFSRRVQENMAQGQNRSQAVTNSPPMITGSVAAGGAQDKNRAKEVEGMIKCVGDRTGQDPGVTSELQGLYRDAVSAERFRQDPSVGNMFKSLFGK